MKKKILVFLLTAAILGGGGAGGYAGYKNYRDKHTEAEVWSVASLDWGYWGGCCFPPRGIGGCGPFCCALERPRLLGIMRCTSGWSRPRCSPGQLRSGQL